MFLDKRSCVNQTASFCRAGFWVWFGLVSLVPLLGSSGVLTAAEHADAVPCAALTRTPLAGLKAQAPQDYLTAWALLGTWTCARVWPTPTSGKWPKACLAATDQLKERQPYLGAWARSSFEQGALCALAAMSSEIAYFFALPGDAVFQCHGVSPCVSNPARAVLPLVAHYYGCKDNIHELHRINALPTLPQALFGHRCTPPYWTIGDWQLLAGLAITTLPRFALTWAVPCWAAWTYDPEHRLNAHLVTPLHCDLADGLLSDTDDPDLAPGGPSNEVPLRTPALDEPDQILKELGASSEEHWTVYAALGSRWPCLPCAPLRCAFRVAAPLGRYASTAVEGQLLACRWPCRVWWAQLAATPLGAAAEEWQPLVPAADDSLGDSR